MGDTVRGCSSVWVDAATGDSASLLYKNRADRAPANGALCACMSFRIESFFLKSFLKRSLLLKDPLRKHRLSFLIY